MQSDDSSHFELSFTHHSIPFTALAEAWPDARSAERACSVLKERIREISRSGTESLYQDLGRSDVAYGDDPVWKGPSMLSLFKLQEEARHEGLKMSQGNLMDVDECRCRLIPGSFLSQDV